MFFVPDTNPYSAKVGDGISFTLLENAKPLANQLVYVGHRHPAQERHHHIHDERSLRTDENGNFTIRLKERGLWFLRTIHMVKSEDPEIDYVSNWATLTFEVR